MSWKHWSVVPSCSIGSDEKILREAFHSDADLRTLVLTSVLTSACTSVLGHAATNVKGERARVHTEATPNVRAEVWLHNCSEAALRECRALASNTQPLRLKVTLRRRISAAPLHAGACLEENDDQLSGHLVRFARRDQFSAASSASSASTVDEGSDFYVVFRNDKKVLDVFGLAPFQWHALPPQVLPLNNKIANAQKSTKHNFFACLDGEEDVPTIEQVVEVLDLHGRAVAQAIEEVEALLVRHARSATSVTSKRGLLHLVVGSGKHSVDGIAAIKPAVQRFLQKRRVAHGTLHNNTGMFWVDVQTICPPSLANESAIVVEDYGYIGDIIHLLMNVQCQLRRGKWPRITDALASPQQRSLLPATLFKGRCSFGDVQLPDAEEGECDQHQLEAIHRYCVYMCVLLLR